MNALEREFDVWARQRSTLSGSPVGADNVGDVTVRRHRRPGFGHGVNVGSTGKEAHLRGRDFQMSFRIGIWLVAVVLDHRMFTDGSEYILLRAAFREVIEHAVDGDRQHVTTTSEPG